MSQSENLPPQVYLLPAVSLKPHVSLPSQVYLLPQFSQPLQVPLQSLQITLQPLQASQWLQASDALKTSQSLKAFLQPQASQHPQSVGEKNNAANRNNDVLPIPTSNSSTPSTANSFEEIMERPNCKPEWLETKQTIVWRSIVANQFVISNTVANNATLFKTFLQTKSQISKIL